LPHPSVVPVALAAPFAQNWLRAHLEVPPLWFVVLVPPAVHARLAYGYDRRVRPQGEPESAAAAATGSRDSGHGDGGPKGRHPVRIDLYILLFYFTCGLWIPGLILAGFYRFLIFLGQVFYAAGGTAMAIQLSVLLLWYNMCVIAVAQNGYKQKGATSFLLIRLIGQVLFLALCVTTPMIPLEWRQSSSETRYHDLAIMTAILGAFEYPACVVYHFVISQR
jgi:hypothetical protein